MSGIPTLYFFLGKTNRQKFTFSLFLQPVSNAFATLIVIVTFLQEALL